MPSDQSAEAVSVPLLVTVQETMALAPLPATRLVGATEAPDTARLTFGAVRLIGTARTLFVRSDSLTLFAWSTYTNRYWLPRSDVLGIVRSAEPPYEPPTASGNALFRDTLPTKTALLSYVALDDR